MNRKVTTWIFTWSSLNYRDGPKSDEIWHIFRPRPQTFCSHTRTAQNFGPRAGAPVGFGSRQPGKVAAAQLIGLGDRQSGSRFPGIRSAISSIVKFLVVLFGIRLCDVAVKSLKVHSVLHSIQASSQLLCVRTVCRQRTLASDRTTDVWLSHH